MADDIKINLGLDANGLFAGLDEALKQVNSTVKSMPDVGEALAQGVPKASSTLKSYVDEQKQLLVALKLQGKEGSDSYKEIEKGIIDAKAELNKLEQAAKDVDASLEAAFDGEAVGGFQGALQGLKGGLSDAFSGGLIGGLVGGGIAGAIQTGIGAIVDGFGAVIDAGRGLISAQGDLQAQTGATGAEFEALKTAADEAFLGGVGESVAEATKIISNAKVVLKDALPNDQLGEFVKGAQALGSLYDKDVNEVIAKSAPFIKQFGLNGKESFDLIAYASKEGKTSQDDVLDTLAEYSQLLQEAGFSAEEFAGSLAVAGQEGLFNTDKIADSIKEAQIRLKAGDTAKALTDLQGQLPKALGSTIGDLQKLASSGQITIKEFLQKSGESIKTAYDAGAISDELATQLQVAIAGTPAEDIGVEAYNKLFGAPIPVEEIKKKAAEAGAAAAGATGQYLTFDSIGRNLTLAFEKSSAFITKAINDVAAIVVPIFTETLGPIFEKFGNTFSDYFQRIWSVAQPILALLGGAIIYNIVVAIESAMVVVDTFYSIWNSAFDAIANAFKPFIDLIKQAFGNDGELQKGKTVVDSFKEVLSNITEVIGEVGRVIADIGKLIIEFLITPIQTVIEVIADVIRSIGGWMSANDQNTESIKESGKAADSGVSFMGKLRTAFDNIRGTIGGVREAFIQIKTTIGEFWDAITQLDIQKALGAFTGFGDKLSAAYDKGFNATRDQIQKTQQAQQEAIKTTTKVVESEEEKKKRLQEEKDKEKKPKGTAPKKDTELEKALNEYQDFSDKLATEREKAVQAEKERLNLTADQTSAYRQKKLLEDTKLSQEKLNELFAGVKTESFQADLKIQANFRQGEIQTDVIKKYQDIFTKNQATLEKSSEVKIKINIPAFKDELKEIDNAVKEYTTTADKLVPINFTTDPAEIAKVQQDVLNFQEFLKSENDRIRLLQQEAQIAGNEEAAQKFSEAINKNIQSINTLENRVKTFAEKSKEEQKKNTLEYQIATALQTSLLDAFNADKIRKEKETNDAIRAERLGALDAEENDLNKSLAKREISAEEYAAKLAEINNGRQKAQEETEVTVLERLKQAGDKVVGDVLKTQGAAFTEQAKKMEGGSKIMYEAMGGLATSFGALAASGKATLKDFAGASIDIAVQAMMKMIPIWTAEIFATSVAELGVGGLAVAAGLQIVLMGLVSAARSAGGFKDGVVGLHGEGTETSDSIPAWLSKGESVITARATRNNREELEFMNRTGLSIAEFYKMKMPSTSVSITPEGDLIREVRKLREETRGLGVRIQRNTSVEVSGMLTADSKSINALIVEQKRRSARRG